MIGIIPAIDIIEGRCVRLCRGDYATSRTYDGSPLDMALRFRDCGVHRIHLVDLDGARMSSPQNLLTLERIAGKVGDLELEWGGGIKNGSALKDVFNAGASRAVIGSVAVLDSELFLDWLSLYGPDRMILGADVRDGKVAVSGWLKDSSLDIADLIRKFLTDRPEQALSQVICTDISRDGMLQGPAVQLYVSLKDKFPSVSFTASGGVSSMADIVELDKAGVPGVIVGKAIYENRISMEDIRLWCANA